MPRSVNEVYLRGHAGKDAGHSDAGTGKAFFSLATSERWKDKTGEWQERTTWHNIVCWGRLAEKAREIRKGDCVDVHGKIASREYEKNGEKQRTTEVIADRVELLDRDFGRQTSESHGEERGGAADADIPF